MKQLLLVLGVLWAGLMFGGCSSSLNIGGNGQAVPVYNYERVEFFLNTTRPDGSVVNDKDFQAFLDTVVLSRFPEGFTVMPYQRERRLGDGRVIREEGRLLVLLSPLEAGSKDKTTEIRTMYQQQLNFAPVEMSAHWVYVKSL